MKLIGFPEQTIVIAKDQPEYLPMPAYVHPLDLEGTTIICWTFSWKERIKLLFTGILWHRILTFRGPMQPMMLMTECPFLRKKE